MVTLIDARLHVTQAEGRFKVPKGDIIGKVAHHSVSGGSFFMAGETTPLDEINHIRMIDAYHVSIDFEGFAYHACAFASGRAYQTGDFDGARAHIWGQNHKLLGWALIGNYADQLPSVGGLAAAGECERAFDVHLGREVPLKGHIDWALAGHGSGCPGRVRERLSIIRNLAKVEEIKEETMFPIFLIRADDGSPEVYTWDGGLIAVHVDGVTYRALKAKGVEEVMLSKAFIGKLAVVS